jgi:pimeloyl-ACP methyl ester carboxylesterase/DNA-binding CsgD family transcriptional regulator
MGSSASPGGRLPKGVHMEQRLGRTQTPDGAQIAYATVGHGAPLLFVGGWLSHLELSWALPAERQLLETLAQGRTLLRYDRPGCGLSDRSLTSDPSPEGELAVIAAVLAAAGVERTDIVASSLGVPLMIDWAARRPETVDRLVLYGGWARGADIGTPTVQEHIVGLVAGHWGLGADVLTDIFLPDASAGTRAALSGYQRAAASPAAAAALLRLCYSIDVTASLGRVRAPTLVVHREHDRAAPLEQAQLMAADIPHARLQVLPGRSHLPYGGDTTLLVRTMRTFLGLPVGRRVGLPSLTRRQEEVAALVTEGLTNREIGERLGIDERSAEGHLERIRLRLGLRSRAQVAAWWVAQDAR